MRAMNPTETNLDATDCMSFTPDLNSSTASWTPPRFFKGISKAALKPIFGEFTRHESGSGKYSVMSTDLEPATSPKVMRRSYMIDGVFLDAIVTRPDDRFSTKSGRNTTTTSKLELFIVCRFGKLSSEDQNLLRIASIVGLLFSKELLFGILSPQMRQHMESSVQSLRRQQWIADSTEESAEYCFVHPLFYQTLYNLTPAGDRAKLHYAVAQFLQQEHEDDPIYFSRLGHHYSLSVGQRPQAFEYFIRSAIHIFTKGPSFIDSGIKLMHHARSFVDTAMDCELVLGICKKEKDRLMKLKQKILQEESVTPSLTRTSFLSLPSRGSFLSIPYRTTKVLPLYSSQKNGSKEGAYEGNDITLEEINHNLDLCDSTEVEYYEIYGEMVYRNLMGEAARWQIPYFRGLLTVGNVARKKSFFFNSADQVDRSPDVSRVVRSLFSTRINTKVTKASEYKFKPQRRRSSHLLAMILSGKKTSSKRNMQQSIKSQVKELIGCSIS